MIYFVETWTAGREFLSAFGKAFCSKNMGNDVGVTLGTENAGPADRHLGGRKRKQGADRLVAPTLEERLAHELRNVTVSLHGNAVAGGASGQISRLATLRLCLV